MVESFVSVPGKGLLGIIFLVLCVTTTDGYVRHVYTHAIRRESARRSALRTSSSPSTILTRSGSTFRTCLNNPKISILRLLGTPWSDDYDNNTATLSDEDIDNKNNLYSNAPQISLDSHETLTYAPNARIATFLAQKMCSVEVSAPSPESPSPSRNLKRYLSLPPEKYSLLDGSAQLTRLDDNNFKCEIDPISFLGNKIVATVFTTVDVDDYPGATARIIVTKCELAGGRFAEFANGQFDIECLNTVSEPEENLMKVQCSIDIRAKIPREGRWLPRKVLSGVGSSIMSTTLKFMLPRFLNSLKQDYEIWKESESDGRDWE